MASETTQDRQIAYLVEALRHTLQGDWDNARTWLDAIDPGKKGTWKNAKFEARIRVLELPTVIDARGKLPVRQGAKPYGTRQLAAIFGVTIHYTASAESTSVDATAEYQIGPGPTDPFPAIAYHYYVEADGTPIRCHNLTTRVWGSAAPNANDTRVHVCFAGDGARPNEAQRRGIQACLREIHTLVPAALSSLQGHNWDYNTLCPDGGTGAGRVWIPLLWPIT